MMEWRNIFYGAGLFGGFLRGLGSIFVLGWVSIGFFFTPVMVYHGIGVCVCL